MIGEFIIVQCPSVCGTRPKIITKFKMADICCKIVLVDTFNLICYLPWFLSVTTKRDDVRTRSSDDEGTLTKRHFSQLLPGYQTVTL